MGSNYYNDSGPQGSGLPSVEIKKFLPIILAIVVVLVAGFLVLSWLNSQQDLTIQLTDPDGSVEGRITLKDSQSKPIIDIVPKGASSSFETKLWPGEYKIDAFVEGYKRKSQSFSVPVEGDELEIELERDLQANITVTFDYAKLFKGQKLSGKINMINTGNQFNIEDLKPEPSAMFDIRITSQSKGALRSGDSIYLDFDASIKETAKLTAPTQDGIQFRLMGSNVKSNKLNVQAMPTVQAIEITFPASVVKTKMEAGKEETIDITVKNNNKTIPIENLELEIVPDSDSTQNLDWFRFSQAGDELHKVNIPSIEPTKSVTIKLYVKTAVSAKINDFFKGTLKATSYSVTGEKTSTMDFKVTTEKDVALKFTASGNPYTISCKKSTSTCENKVMSNNEVKIKNEGDVEITNLKIEIDYINNATSANCPQYLRSFIVVDSADGSKITSIKPNEEKGIKVELTAPFAGEEKDSATCVVKWTYIDPLDPTQTLKENYTIKISKTTS